MKQNKEGWIRWSIGCAALALCGCAQQSVSSSALTTAGDTAKEMSAATSEPDGLLGYLGSMTGKALEAVGLKKPDLPALDGVTPPDGALPQRRITWRIHASTSLNVTPSGEPAALLTRLYRLRSPDAFLRAPADTFDDSAKEKALLGDDLVSVREVQLIPGQAHESVDSVPREVRYIGIVALYRSPAAGRWRYAFPTEAAARTGLTVGAHACALSVQTGEPIGLALKYVQSAAAPCPR